MDYGEIKVRSYEKMTDRERVEFLEKTTEVSLKGSFSLSTDTLGDPLCRIRNVPLHRMLVAELGNELVGVVRGTIKIVTIRNSVMYQAKVGYILGLRVASHCRRRGVGSMLVCRLEEWFNFHSVDCSYMATEKDNEASVKLFLEKLGYNKFRTPTILISPLSHRLKHISEDVNIMKLSIKQAETLYRKFMGSTEFFPQDIDRILNHDSSLGTWVAHCRSESLIEFDATGSVPSNWAMLSVWNSGDLFKLKVSSAPLKCVMYSKFSTLLDRLIPCLRFPALPNVSRPFGIYFMYGICGHGPKSGFLVQNLCRFVHILARKCSSDCKFVVTELGGCDSLSGHIPHWKSLSCPEDLWCIKTLNKEKAAAFDWTKSAPSGSFFVDPREV